MATVGGNYFSVFWFNAWSIRGSVCVMEWQYLAPVAFLPPLGFISVCSNPALGLSAADPSLLPWILSSVPYSTWWVGHAAKTLLHIKIVHDNRCQLFNKKRDCHVNNSSSMVFQLDLTPLRRRWPLSAYLIH